MFVRMLKLPASARTAHDLSSLRYAVHAAAPCPVEVKRQHARLVGSHHPRVLRRDRGHRIHVDHRPRMDGPPRLRRAARQPGPHRWTGRRRTGPRPGGNVYFEGGRPFEYHNDPEKDGVDHRQPGLAHPGRHRAYLDEDGYLYLTDRQAHMIISGGVNIYPQEAENVLAGHAPWPMWPSSASPTRTWAKRSRPWSSPSTPVLAGPELEAELIDYCRRHLATYKCPRTVDFASELPRDPTASSTSASLRERLLGRPRHPAPLNGASAESAGGVGHVTGVSEAHSCGLVTVRD